MIKSFLFFFCLVSIANARVQDWPRAGEIRFRPKYQKQKTISSPTKDIVSPSEKTSKEANETNEKDDSFQISELRSWLDSGEIIFRPSYQINNQPITDPLNIFFEDKSYYGRLYGLFKLEKTIANFRMISQLRPRLDYTDREINLNVGVDELYFDYAITEAIYIGLGKHNIFTGVGLGNNVTDYFGENKEPDPILDEVSRRDQRKGDYMLNIDWFFNNSSLNLYYAPRMGMIQKEQTKLLLSYNYFFESIDSDISSFLFIGERSGIGFNFSKNMNDNWILYSELSFRKGRDKLFIRNNEDTRDDIYIDAIFGSNYTFNNGLNIFLEYWHKSNGYDGNEWNTIIEETNFGISHINNNNLKIGIPQLGKINQSLRARFLRQNYLFSRFSYSFNKYFDLSLVHILNIDDSSQFIRALVEKEFGGNFGVGFQVEQYFGDEYEEFGIRPADSNYTLYFKSFF
ncbi:MAG: hypothetical protein L3J59_12305 [Methylococcaceae bacterium]|nr:hypothetical protein [Methylococcaceae bacterium]